ncbi:TPA: colicin-like bacteriocin tRNase domain-containing protein [Klebsiella oxytoca]
MLTSGKEQAAGRGLLTFLDNVHDGVQFVSAVFAGSMQYNLPVVKAQATAGSDYYTIGRLPGIMSAFTFSFYTKGTPQDSRFFRDTVKAGGDLREAGFTVGANTSDFIIWFPQGSGLEPLYFSMTMNMPAGPLQRRQEAENKARAEADRLRAEAEAKIRAEAEARAKAEAERKALFAKAGIQDTPVYTPEMVKAANAALSAGGSMALSRAPGMIQHSAAGVGTLPFNSSLAGWEAGALWRGVDVLARIAPVASAVATVATVLTLVRAALDIPAAGEGSDRVPGRNIDMLAAQASLYTAMKTNIQPGMKTVDLPVRGYISYDGNGRQSVNLVRTGTGGVSATVPVLSAVRDKTTGLDKITVPAVAGAPSRTILINPVPVGPATPSHTGSSTPVPVTPVHTGTDVKQADSIVTTTLPAADIPALQDFIYWQPDATGTGVEPIYVMLSDPLDSGKYTRRQLQKKYKHAIDFGITDTKINGETLTKFRDAIEAHLSDKDTFEKGTYRRDKGSKVYFNPKTMNAVIIQANGDFLSGWKINPAADNGRIYLETGDL